VEGSGGVRQRYRDLMIELAGRVLLPFRTVYSLWLPDQDLQAGLYIVRDSDEWTRLTARSASNQPPGPPAPAVNWQIDMCVVVALGTRPSGGYRVLIDTIDVIDGHIRVLAWEIRPGRNCGTTRALTHPFHVVAAPAHAGEAKLVKRVADEDCEATEY